MKYFAHIFKKISLMVGVVVLFVAFFKRPTTKKLSRKKNGVKGQGFIVNTIKGRPEGPDLVFVEGGLVVLGEFTDELAHTGYTPKRNVTVLSFYMDETPITNTHWLTYLSYLERDSAEEVYKAAIPDITVWERALAYNDPFVKFYLRSPGFRYYPVVGVSYVQAENYCKWRSSVINEYLAQKYKKKYKKVADETVPIESGYVLPDYRLPSEAEWEHAAKAMVGTQSLDFSQSNQRIYPWDGSSLRNSSKKHRGKFLANFKRGRGNYKGVPGESDSNGATGEVYDYPPNDLGLYGMAGNVNEWVSDIYRPNSSEDVDDFSPMRRDETLDPSSNYNSKYSLINNRSRVYKGGSWKDVSYWLTPGARRYLDQDSSTATIGFRCVMESIGR